MPFVVKESKRVEKSEGDYRWKHAKIRKNAEEMLKNPFFCKLYNFPGSTFLIDQFRKIFNIKKAIAMMRAASFESSLTQNNAEKLFSSQNRMANKAFFLDFSVNTFDYLGGILSYICLAPLILNGPYHDKDPGELTEIIQEKIH